MIKNYSISKGMDYAEHQQKLMSLLSKFVNKNYINKFEKNINNKFSNNINENALFMIFKLYDKKNIRAF